MLRTDERKQITSDRYYHVLGYKSEGGAGDTQIDQFVDRTWRAVHREEMNRSGRMYRTRAATVIADATRKVWAVAGNATIFRALDLLSRTKGLRNLRSLFDQNNLTRSFFDPFRRQIAAIREMPRLSTTKVGRR